MTANRVDTFEAWIRSVEKRVIRLERKPRSGGGGTGGGEAIGGFYRLPFKNGVGSANLPAGVVSNAYVVGSFTFTSGQEVGLAVSIVSGIARVRAPVSDGTYDTTLIFVNP